MSDTIHLESITITKTSEPNDLGNLMDPDGVPGRCISQQPNGLGRCHDQSSEGSRYCGRHGPNVLIGDRRYDKRTPGMPLGAMGWCLMIPYVLWLLIREYGGVVAFFAVAYLVLRGVMA